jgi:hypothetical protein
MKEKANKEVLEKIQQTTENQKKTETKKEKKGKKKEKIDIILTNMLI